MLLSERAECADLTQAQSHQLEVMGMMDPKTKIIGLHPHGPLVVRGNGDWEIVKRGGSREVVARGWLSRGRDEHQEGNGANTQGL